jgi:hypothetical protein
LHFSETSQTFVQLIRGHYTSDNLIFCEGTLPGDFWSLADQLDSGPVPDEILSNLVTFASQLSVGTLASIFDDSQQLTLDRNINEFSRNVTYAIKLRLLQRQGLNQHPALLEDRKRVAYMARVDEVLAKQAPLLEKLHFDPGHVLGTAAVSVQTKEPEIVQPGEEVQSEALLRRMSEVSANPRFQLFVGQFRREFSHETYALIMTPVMLTLAGLDIGIPYWVSRNVTPATLQSIDGSSWPLVWRASILVGEGRLYYDSELLSVLNRNVYLQLKEFSWPRALECTAPFPGEAQLVSYKLRPEMALTVSAIHKGNVTIFGLTPLRYLDLGGLPQNLKEEEGFPMGSLEMAAVVLIVLRQSNQHTI